MSAPTAPVALVEGRTRVDDDLALAWEQRGSGTPVTCVNNFFMERSHWRSVTADLVDDHALLAYDLRNQGSSGRRAGSTWSDHLDDLARVLDDRGIDSTHLLASCDSSLLCRDFARRHPDRVRGLVLVGPALGPHGDERIRWITRSWIDVLDHQGMEALFASTYPLVFGDALTARLGRVGYVGRKMGFLQHVAAAELRAGLAMMLDVPGDPALLAEVAAPTLLLVGDDDFVLGAGAARAVAERFADARVEVMERAGHLPFLDDPDGFQRRVAAFLAAVESRA